LTAVLALDLGGTSFKAATVTDDGIVSGYRTAPSAESAGLEGWLDAALALARDGFDAPVTAIGLSVPGAIDPRSGTLLGIGARLDAGDGVSLPEAFAEFELPVFADNDARAALAAERRFGAAKGCDDAVMLTLGTGLGGAVVIRGDAAGGEAVMAGSQIGHFTIAVDGPPCTCGNRGCAEVFASATGLRRLAAVAGVDITEARDAFAIPAVVDTFTEALAATIVTAIHAYQPEIVVLGGGLMGSADQFLPRVQKLVAERAWTTPGRRARIEPSALGEHMGVLGAAAVALERITS
jgi:glucokinase